MKLSFSLLWSIAFVGGVILSLLVHLAERLLGHL